MDYYIAVTKGNDQKVISKHTNLDDAIGAGKSIFEKSSRGEVVSCITGKVNSDGKIVGQYRLIKAWY